MAHHTLYCGLDGVLLKYGHVVPVKVNAVGEKGSRCPSHNAQVHRTVNALSRLSRIDFLTSSKKVLVNAVDGPAAKRNDTRFRRCHGHFFFFFGEVGSKATTSSSNSLPLNRLVRSGSLHLVAASIAAAALRR